MRFLATKPGVVVSSLVLIVTQLITVVLPWWHADIVPASGQPETVSFSGADLSALLVLLSLASALVVLVTALVQKYAGRAAMGLLVLLQLASIGAWISLQLDIANVLARRMSGLSANLVSPDSYTLVPVAYLYVLAAGLLCLWSLRNIFVVGTWSVKRAKFDRATAGDSTKVEQPSDIEVWDAISDGSDPTG